MSDLPIEIKKENIFKKFFKFVKNIFKKEPKVQNETVEEEYIIPKERKVTELYKVDNLDEITSSVIEENNKKIKMQEIIDIIEKNPSTLEKLDIAKLEIIDNYYKEKIDEYKKKLANISSN